LQEVVVAVLEMRSLPLLCPKRAEDGVCVHCVGVIMKMIDEAPDLKQQSALCRRNVPEAQGWRLFAEERVFEAVGRMPFIIEKSFRTLKQAGGSLARNNKRACRALKRPEEVLDHMLRSHVPPLWRCVLVERHDCVGQKSLVERRTKRMVVNIKRNYDHFGVISFLRVPGLRRGAYVVLPSRKIAGLSR